MVNEDRLLFTCLFVVFSLGVFWSELGHRDDPQPGGESLGNGGSC